MNNIDEAFEEFKNFADDYEALKAAHLSESDTRSKLLDRILIKVLGWSESDIVREGYVEPGYFDYEISTSIFAFVVEAKKNLSELLLPSVGNRVTLNTLMKGNAEIIEQIRDYIYKRNLSYGVISNGHQFVIGKFVNTDGSDWSNNMCIFFNGIEKIGNDFIEFHNLLSKASILKNNRIKIAGPDYVGKKITESFTLHNRTAELVRNDLSSQLIPIISNIFSEISNTDDLENREMLEKCYVTNNHDKKTIELLHYSMIILQHLTKEFQGSEIQRTRRIKSRVKFWK